jgi:hypothetical protein
MTIDLLNNVGLPVFGIGLGFFIGMAILKMIAHALGALEAPGPISRGLEDDLRDLRHELAKERTRIAPPPVPSKPQLNTCGYCGQPSKGNGPCPQCGAPRI